MTQTIFPGFRYRDAEAALQFLKDAFAAVEHSVYRGEDGAIRHAVIEISGGMIMFGQYSQDGFLGGGAPDPIRSTVSVYIVESDPDAHHARAVAAGARVVRDLEDTAYGSREYSVRDLEGNLWSFGTYDPATFSDGAVARSASSGELRL
jgi:uncharacterized glyoxalase superfamily protein PhnB